MFNYYTVNDTEQIRFYQLPKELVKHEKFKGLSDSAKILYALLRDRVTLSVKNNWVDEFGRVYIIFTLTEIMEDLSCADQKATKAMKELQKIGLVESVRRGLGKPNIIYVKNFATGIEKKLETPISPLTRENHDSGLVKITNQESLESRISIRENHEQPIRNLKDTYSMDTESESESMSDKETEKDIWNLENDNDNDYDCEFSKSDKTVEKEKEPPVSSTKTESSSPNRKITQNLSDYDYNTYRIKLQENINYSFYTEHRNTDIDLIDELMECMLDVICTPGDTVKIGKEQKPRSMVITQYLKINSMDIEHIIDRYKEQQHKIKHLHNYLKTMLYTVKQESGFYYTNAVLADGML